MKKSIFFLYLSISTAVYAANEVPNADSYVNFAPVSFSEPVSAANLVINLPYDRAVYLLAFNTFLANKNIPAAISVAEKAVKADPDNLFWHEELAQVAVWGNNTDLAMEQLIYLLNVKKDKKTLDKMVELGAYTSHFKDVISAGKIYLPKYPYDSNLVIAMVASYSGLDQPAKAIELLHQVLKYDPRKIYFTLLIGIYTTLQNNAAIQKTALLQQKKEGPSADNALTLADTYYASNDLKTAERALLKAAPKVSFKNTDFWMTLANTAWLLNDFQNVIFAYQQLSKAHKLDASSALQYIQLLLINQPYEGINQSLVLWRKDHDNNGLILAANYLESYYTFSMALYFFSHISGNAEKSLKYTVSYWGAKTHFMQNLGENDLAQQMLIHVIQTQPDQPAYSLLYLAFLINQVYFGFISDSMTLLPITLSQWADRAGKYDGWLSVYANAYLVMNNLLLSYAIDKPQFNEQKNNLDYLTRFASTSYSYGYPKIAKGVGLYTLSIIKKNLINTDNINVYRVFLAMGQPYLSIDDYYRGLCWLTQQRGDLTKEPLLDWALSNGHLALADAIVEAYGRDNYPAWAQLKLAMQHNDVQAMYRLLTEHPTTLPKDDYVTAANQINDISLAGLASVQTLRKPTAAPDQNTAQMIQLTTNAANSVSAAQEYDIYGTLQGNKTKVDAKFNMGNNVTLEPYANAWFAQSNDLTQMVNLPEADQEAGVKYTKQTQNNWYRWDAGVRQDLATFATLSFEDSYKLNQDLSFDMELGYNQLATQTTNLWVTSVQDIADITLNYNFSSFDNVTASANGSEFYSQEGTYVGDGLQLMLTANHKFWLSYPDYTVGWFGEIDKYGANGTVTPFMAQVIPADQTADIAAFIPQSFWQSGVTLSFGQNLLKTQSNRFRPYSTMSLFHNSVSGNGETIEGGMLGSVFGADLLNIYASYSKNSGGVAQVNEVLGVRYQYFYG